MANYKALTELFQEHTKALTTLLDGAIEALNVVDPEVATAFRNEQERIRNLVAERAAAISADISLDLVQMQIKLNRSKIN